MKRGKSRLKSSSGFTLIEALVSSVLAGMAAVIVFSIIAAAPKAIIPINHYDQALQSATALSESLKNFVSGDTADNAIAAGYAPQGSWKINPADACGDALKLNCGHPQLPSSWLAQELLGLGATMNYSVADKGNGLIEATINVHWDEPQ